MARALELARPHHPHPNPRVGAVVVDQSGRVVGEGSHLGPGNPHAEVIAIEQAGDRARGAVLYVTLEPCTHHGKTPPCVDAIVAGGLATVVVATDDPDPRVSGQGIAKLRAAGIEVVEGVMSEEARDLDPGYFHHRSRGLPLIVMKYAMTIDGSVAAADTSSKWITTKAAREDSHRLRADMDAVMVGSGTIRADDPLLNVRMDDYEGPQPRPVILLGTRPLPDGARIWDRDPVVVTTSAQQLDRGTVVRVAGVDGRPDPAAAAQALGELGLLTILLEGGPGVAGAWWRAGLIDRGVVYIGSKVGGGTGRSPLGGAFGTIDDARVVTITGVNSLDGDLRVDFVTD